MSSREIAELTGKEHFHVMRDIREMLAALAEDESEIGGIYLDAYGREQACFNLPKDLTITLVAGYNVQMRHNDFLARCKDELDGEPYETFVEPSRKTDKGLIPAFEAIRMTIDQCKLVGMSESKGVPRGVWSMRNTYSPGKSGQ